MSKEERREEQWRLTLPWVDHELEISGHAHDQNMRWTVVNFLYERDWVSHGYSKRIRVEAASYLLALPMKWIVCLLLENLY